MSQGGPPKKPKTSDSVHKETAREMAGQEEEDYSSSPDMFAEYDQPSSDTVIQIESDIEYNTQPKNVFSRNDGVVDWKGTSLKDIMEGCDQPQLPHIRSSESHRVLFRLPLRDGDVPTPFLERGNEDRWDGHHVRMPDSPQNLYLIEKNEGKPETRSRWSVITAAFSRPLESSHDLERAILSYNAKYRQRWDFSLLHYFFNEELQEEERAVLIADILPFIIALALSLPKEITSPIPLLRRGRSHSLSLSQRQAAVLLANAFLCTFPRRNAMGSKGEYSNFPSINFIRLFGTHGPGPPQQRQIEKLKCIFHYFARVKKKVPQGVVTFSRRFLEKGRLPRWDQLGSRLTPLHVTSSGTIEDNGLGMLQADFANSLVGGGVLGSGCVQEEIRFVICPEMIVARLFTEQLDSNEVLLLTGCERFTTYSGYADSFQWDGDFHDETCRDASGRIQCTVVAMDALFLRNPEAQFTAKCMLREVNKAFIGCSNPGVENRLAPFATGNWGCGAFGGDPNLKAVLQIIAAAGAERAVVYFTFGDTKLRDNLHAMHAFLVEQHVTVAQLWAILLKYRECLIDRRPACDLYTFIYNKVLNEDSCQTSDKTSAVNTNKPLSSSTNDGPSTSHVPMPLAPLAPLAPRLVPEMDEATWEAKLARIENTGNKKVPEAPLAPRLETETGGSESRLFLEPSKFVEEKENPIDSKSEIGSSSKVVEGMKGCDSKRSSFDAKQKTKITDYFTNSPG